jgi:ABC-2 type transport system ATP-binding protein
MDGDRIRRRCDELLPRLGLAGERRRFTGSVPLGFKQRLALGSAVLHEPPIVFLDEPTAGVDPVARRAFWDLIYELADGGTTVFVTTHYMDEAEYCARVSIMAAGKIIAIGSPAELKERTGKRSMQDVFLEVVEE